MAVRRERAVGIRYPIEEITILVAMLLVQGVFIYAAGDFRPADLAVFGAFLIVLQQALRDYKLISEFSVRVSEELPRLEAVAGLFSDEGKFIVPSGEKTFGGLEHGIDVSKLHFSYAQAAEALHDINATIPAGKVTAIVGSSGAGKTTFVDLLARFYDCESNSAKSYGTLILSSPSLVTRGIWWCHSTTGLPDGIREPLGGA